MLKDIYRRIVQQRAVTKPELANQLEVSLTAVSEYVNQLERAGWVIPTNKAESTGGRRAQRYSMNPKHRFIMGGDIRAEHCYLFLADLSGQVLQSTVLTMETNEYGQYVERLAAAILDCIERWGVPKSRILAIGFCISGITDWSHQVVDRSVELDWTRVPLGLDMRWRLGISTFVEMDARIYARNELHPKDSRNAVGVLFVNRGIGVALILNNEIFRGYTNRAGENRFFFPFITSMEDFVERNQTMQQILAQPYYHQDQRATMDALNRQFTEHVRSNPRARVVVDHFAAEAGQMLYSMASLINPRKLVLTGNVFDYLDYIYEGTKASIESYDRIYQKPVVTRGSAIDSPLERGIAAFLLEKFHALKQFSI